MWYCILGIFLLILITGIYMLISQKNKYLQEKLENQKTLKEIMDRYSFALKENIELKKLVDLYENENILKLTLLVFAVEK